MRARTFYAPALVDATPTPARVERDVVLVVTGRGGGVTDGARWSEAARAVPGRRWRIIGPCTLPADPPPNLESRGWVDGADAMIAGAGVIVGAAGDGLVSSVIAHRKPFVCLPEPRPFDEQVSKASRLGALEAAVVVSTWPRATEWPVLLDQAMARVSAWPGQLTSAGGPGRVARWLQALVEPDLTLRSLRA